MPQQVRLTGEVSDVFSHRFVVAAEGRRYLADIGPKAAASADLHPGDQVTIEGEQKPSEIKVSKLTRNGVAVEVDWPGPSHGPKATPPFRLELSAAVKAAEDAGYEVVGDPKRGPKHFELLVRKDGEYREIHVHEDGGIGKSRPVGPNDPKWRETIAAE